MKYKIDQGVYYISMISGKIIIEKILINSINKSNDGNIYYSGENYRCYPAELECMSHGDYRKNLAEEILFFSKEDALTEIKNQYNKFKFGEK